MNESEHLGFHIRTISNLIQREVDRQEAEKGGDALTGINRFILRYLASHRDTDVFQKDLEDVFSARRSTMSVVLHRMEEKELISRRSVSRDARLKKIMLTEKGEKVFCEMESSVKELENKLMQGFSPAEKEMLLSLLRRVRRNMETETEEQKPKERKQNS